MLVRVKRQNAVNVATAAAMSFVIRPPIIRSRREVGKLGVCVALFQRYEQRLACRDTPLGHKAVRLLQLAKRHPVLRRDLLGLLARPGE